MSCACYNPLVFHNSEPSKVANCQFDSELLEKQLNLFQNRSYVASDYEFLAGNTVHLYLRKVMAGTLEIEIAGHFRSTGFISIFHDHAIMEHFNSKTKPANSSVPTST